MQEGFYVLSTIVALSILLQKGRLLDYVIRPYQSPLSLKLWPLSMIQFQHHYPRILFTDIIISLTFLECTSTICNHLYQPITHCFHQGGLCIHRPLFTSIHLQGSQLQSKEVKGKKCEDQSLCPQQCIATPITHSKLQSISMLNSGPMGSLFNGAMIW